ncbi:hypothetical protein [Neolewinella xylanilytica]|uniref:hypothetical protein n=1 Tax=Neolewinella xylanilytica TaxID=1514080 RepID=UPI000CEAE65F|nr:hypothetical protein [Neolewinella xylanilytica]
MVDKVKTIGGWIIGIALALFIGFHSFIEKTFAVEQPSKYVHEAKDGTVSYLLMPNKSMAVYAVDSEGEEIMREKAIYVARLKVVDSWVSLIRRINNIYTTDILDFEKRRDAPLIESQIPLSVKEDLLILDGVEFDRKPLSEFDKNYIKLELTN